MKRQEIEPLLPEVFQRTVRPGSALFALLETMAELHQPAEDVLSRLDSVFDPRRTPDRFVPFLAAWADLTRILPVTTGLGCLRQLIAVAAELSQRRGTARGLILFLETATSIHGFEVDERVPGPRGQPRPFHIRIRAPQSAAAHQALVERIIGSEKPAYLTYDLEFAGTSGGGN